MEITFVGKKPNKKVFEYSVVGNAKVDKIDFILTTTPSDIYSLSELADFLPFVKVQSVGLDYVDKIKTTSEIIDENLVVSFTLQSKTTQYRNIAVQLQFENDEGKIIAQCEMVGLALSGNINADREIPDKYPSVLVNLEYRISRLEQGITADTYSQEEIDEFLSHKQDTLTFDDVPTEDSENVVKSGGVYDAIENAKTIVFDDPNNHLDESGLNKIYRPIDDNGNVDKSYVITKTYYPSTFVGITPHYTDNYDFVGDTADFIGDFDDADNDFYDIFGDNISITELTNAFNVYYNVNNEETHAISFGTLDNGYGSISIEDCEPNKLIKVVVGKYFEYDQQGNKVFDEHCAFYCTQVVGDTREVREITEERQEFELKTDGNGSLYFDSDGNDLGFGDTRFFLYEIKCGEHEHTEYKVKEIGSGGGGSGTTLKHPTFIQFRRYDNEKQVVVKEDCRVLFSQNRLKCSKLTLQNWFNTSKGNTITNVNVPAGTYTYGEFVYQVLVAIYPFSQAFYHDLTLSEYGLVGWKKGVATFSNSLVSIYHYSDFITNIRHPLFTTNLITKRNKLLNSYGSKNAYGCSVKLKLRFVRNFELRVENDNTKGWKGEMNANELQVYIVNQLPRSNDYVLVITKWQPIK